MIILEIRSRLEPIQAAQLFVKKNYPTCQGAILAGSVVREETTPTSDLDIVIFDQNIASSYRESLVDGGWPIEVFVHSLTSYKSIFESDCKRARPSMPRMVSEGIAIKDVGVLQTIKEEAKALLENGPEVWSEETIKTKRYFITDTLYDFIGCSKRTEEIFIAATLAELMSEFILRVNRQWIGTSKWIIRSLRHYDEVFASDFANAFDLYYKTGKKKQVIQLVEHVLQPYGGMLFDGFSIGKG